MFMIAHDASAPNITDQPPTFGSVPATRSLPAAPDAFNNLHYLAKLIAVLRPHPPSIGTRCGHATFGETVATRTRPARSSPGSKQAAGSRFPPMSQPMARAG